jgi:hypothetical protein
LKPLAQWGRAELDALIGTAEGLVTDFKRSDSLRFVGNEKNSRVGELARDVSALANAAGGRIYYGVVEERSSGRAEAFDDGLTDDEINIDRIGALLNGNIEPAIAGVSVYKIPLKENASVVIVDVPSGSTLAPHQSRYDKKYYRRYDRQNQPMYDHEIKDIMRRGSAPILSPIFWSSKNDENNSYNFTIGIVNEGNEPAIYTVVDVSLDAKLYHDNIMPGWNKLSGMTVVAGHGYYTFQRMFIPPHFMPIFRPRPYELAKPILVIPPDQNFILNIAISCPGFHRSWSGHIAASAGQINADLKADLEPMSMNSTLP